MQTASLASPSCQPTEDAELYLTSALTPPAFLHLYGLGEHH